MKRKYVNIAVALVFGTGGYLLGVNQNGNFIVRKIGKQDSVEDYKDAYKKGCSHWFSSYGMSGEEFSL